MNKLGMAVAGGVGLMIVAGLSFVVMSEPPAEDTPRTSDTPTPAGSLDQQAQLATAWVAEISPFDKVMGSAEAPVTVIEYASFTCGHCADFHAETLPGLKETYIDTGQVRFVFRDFPLDGLALRAGMLARCGRDDQFFSFVDAIFAAQGQWIRDEEPLAALERLANLAGIGPDQFAACMADEALSNEIIQLRLDAQERYDIRATPSFVIDGEVVSGHIRLDEFSALLDDRLTAR